jgi:hypothetical protein
MIVFIIIKYKKTDYLLYVVCVMALIKEKLQAAFLLSGPLSLHDVDLQATPIDFTALFVFLCFFFFFFYQVKDIISPAILSGRGLASMRYRFGQSNLCLFHPFFKK